MDRVPYWRTVYHLLQRHGKVGSERPLPERIIRSYRQGVSLPGRSQPTGHQGHANSAGSSYLTRTEEVAKTHHVDLCLQIEC
jgi:hypothetical protein